MVEIMSMMTAIPVLVDSLYFEVRRLAVWFPLTVALRSVLTDDHIISLCI